MDPGQCILCSHEHIELFYEDTSKQYRSTYYTCKNCCLIFAPEQYRPSPEEELERYDQHENNPEDHRYRAFLGQLFDPVNELLSPHSKGLDFGSGPGPTLHIMFEEQGHRMNIYDPFYADNPAVFEETYDFITATEVAEHLHQPGKEFERLWNCLQPGGCLGIMTKMAPKNDRPFFANWHYRLDNTHVTFYTKDTFRWLAAKWSAAVTFFDNNVVIFKKIRAANSQAQESTGEKKRGSLS